MTLRELCIAIPVFLVGTTCGIATAEAEETEAATRQYAVAVGFQNQKLYDSAIDEWKTFLKKFPDDPRVDRAQHYLGTCSLQEKQFVTAVAAFRTVVDKYPKSEMIGPSTLNLGLALYGIAQESEKPADYAKAGKVLSQMIAKFPKSEHLARALYYNGECLFQTDNADAAAASFSELIQKFPRDEMAADATYALGTAQEALKQTEKARVTFARFTSQYPRHPLLTEVAMRQAELLFAEEKYEAAQAAFAKVRTNKEFHLADTAMMREARCLYEIGKLDEAGRVYWNLTREFRNTKLYDAAVLAGAKCYFLTGEYSRARSGLERIAGRNVPEAPEANQWLARSFLKEKQPNRALEVLDRALTRFRTGPQRAELELARIDTLYELASRKSQAIDLYAEFSRKYPRHELAAQSQYMAALTALDVQNHAAAKQHADDFLQRFPNDRLTADVLFIAAEGRLLLEEYVTAVKHYRDFLGRDADHVNASQAKVRLGLALHMAGENTLAIDWLKPIASKLPDKTLRSEAFGLLGRCYSARDNFEESADALLKSYVEDPDRERTDETLLALSDSYRQLGRNRDANEQLGKLIDRFPNSSLLDEATFRRGEAAYADEDFDRAIAHYASVTAKWPDGEFAPHAQYGLGWTHFNRGDYEKSIVAMSKLIEKYGDSEIGPKGLYVRAMASFQVGELPPVIKDVDAFLATKPKPNDGFDALYVKGLALAGQQKFEQAATTYAEILRPGTSYPAADKVAYELGWAFLELGKSEQAVAAFRRLVKDWPDSPLAAESLFRVGESYYESEQFADAAKAYSDAAAKAGESEIGEKAMHKLGWSFLKAEDYAKAEAAFTKQISSFNSGELTGDARFLTGECSFHQEKWETALAAYGNVISARNGNYLALALYRSGECYASLEKWEESRKLQQRVLEEHTDFELKAEARYGLGWALQNLGMLNEAMALYEKVTEESQSETAAKARYMVGSCLFAQKKHKEAAKQFLKAAFGYNHKNWSALAYFEAARCFEVLRDLDQARNCYQQLITKYPQHRTVANARKRLAALGS